jgi:hypothetical protein
MVYASAIYSLIIQFIIGIIDILGLNIEIPKDKEIFKDLLKLELVVQSVEFLFYVWMIFSFSKFENITPFRYYDWMITTPSMLITLTAYLSIKNYPRLIDYIKDNFYYLLKIMALNMAMLGFGLLGELNIIDYKVGVLLGFIPFIYYYKVIYDTQIKEQETTNDRKGLFWFFFVIWALYGVAALLPYIQKNTMYNILDLFSKNLLGLILVYIIWKNRISN